MRAHRSDPPTQRQHRLRRRGLAMLAAAILAACLGILATPATAQQPQQQLADPGRYYLSLGDSMGFGLQLKKFLAMIDGGTYTPTAFDTGYTDNLATKMRALRPNLQVINYSCPAAGLHQMRAADCAFAQDFALHNGYDGAQLDAAVALLHAHPGRVSPITVSIGGNDVATTFYQCNGDSTCIQNSDLSRHLTGGLSLILRRLRVTAPTAQIVLVIPHDVTLRDFPGDDALWAGYMDQMRAIAAQTHVAIADLSARSPLPVRPADSRSCATKASPTATPPTPDTNSSPA